MIRIAFKPSSNIAAVEYEEATRDLAVTFQSGETYIYANVAPELAHGFANAPSAGTYLNRMVKPGYSYRRA